MEEEDEIISEIDVFATSSFREDAALIQLPLMPRNTEFELEGAFIDKKEDSYVFILPAPDLSLISDETYQHEVKASRIKSNSNIALGIFRNGSLHLSPLTKIYQCRPVNEKRESELTALSIDYMTNIDLFTVDDSNKPMDLSMDIRVTTYREGIPRKDNMLSREMIENVSESSISSRSPSFQLFYQLVVHKNIDFIEVIKSLNLTPHVQELLPILTQYAWFVQGRWVVKSEYLYENELPLSHRIARNFIIVLFHYEKVLEVNQHKHFLKLFRIEKNEQKCLFDKLAVMSKSPENESRRVLCFTYRPSTEFERNYREVAQQARNEIQILKESICFAKQDEHLFEEFI